MFDKAKTRELPRFFDELEYLLERAAITSETEKKRQLLRYVDFEIEQMWKTFPEYTDPQKTYDDFKKAILVHYPDATGDYVYSLRDMDVLIGESQRVGITTLHQLSDFHMQFFAITSWLISKQQLGDLEQKRGYMRAFQPALLASITSRLQLKFPDHHPSIPHKIADVYEAARFVLQCAPAPAHSYYAPSPPTAQQTLPTESPNFREPTIKTEAFTALFTEFTKTIVDAIQKNGTPYNQASDYRASATKNCFFCNGPHLTKDCDLANEYCRSGKCQRGPDGRIVLPSGLPIPREIPGRLLKDRIDEWHRRNVPQNSPPISTMLHTISSNQSTSARVPTYHLTTTDRIATLEAELFNLKARNQVATSQIRTRAMRAKEAEVGQIDPPASTTSRKQTPYIEEVAEPAISNQERVPEKVTVPRTYQPRIEEESEIDQQPQSTNNDNRASVTGAAQPVRTIEHPYRAAKDATYVPPIARNVGAPAKAPYQPRRFEPAYKSLPSIHDPKIAEDVYKRSMDAQITISQRELLSLSPEVRAQVRECTTTRRVPIGQDATNQHLLRIDEAESDEEETVETFAIQGIHTRTPPQGATILSDPIETYYQSLRPGEEPDADRLTVARPSAAIRSIYALVDNSQKKECTLDPGCQVIAMSKNTCHGLGLGYDPSICLNMESANGNLDWSLGLSRNVPFRIGAITLYMQAHVIRSPAYDILLGRPFDILTESVVKNYANEDQTITITDPNSNQQITIPTFARKGASSNAHAAQDFQ